ncbi:cytochrome P450 [Parachitinimonas caeni]|uniref:Cytochrome P450 n=1 Tax=Parachitinimonas caeni TaxID=3031301 RepID=A0ABT7E3K8_9NEIS|nr:cytochrome P450 [Parachitinimonas caeni]MDK2126902.1 cytochrome P450 [Parachitinimonas caeni]
MLTAARWFRNPYAVLDRHRAAGRFQFMLGLPGMGQVWVTGEPTQIGEIVRNPDLLGGRGTRALRPVIGEHSLLALEGAEHALHRRWLLPPFFHANPQRFASLQARVLEQALAALKPGQPVNLRLWAKQISLQVIVRCLFGELPAAEVEKWCLQIEHFMQSFRSPLLLFIKPLQQDLGERSPWGRFVRRRAELLEAIRQRWQAPLPGSILAELKASCPPQINEAAMLSEVISLLLFGHDTSAVGLAWWALWLWQHPDALQRAREEALAGQAGEYLRATVQESLRLTPPVVHLTRTARQATQVAGQPIAAGQHVFPCIYLAQRHPDAFPEPDTFRPERFLGSAPHFTEYFPFGLGHRLCIGMPFALEQMVQWATHLLREPDLAVIGQSLAPRRVMVLMAPACGPMLVRQ